MRILIAEDDAVSRHLLTIQLRKWGHEVVVCENGERAWKVYQEPDPPAIAILDWMMPEMDGVELCRRVRKTLQESPPYLILLTAKTVADHVVEGLRAGANDYVTKPFRAEELRARIEVGQRVVELQAALARRVAELQDALEHVKTLQGLVPICMHCHRIRSDRDAWEKLEEYVEAHSEAEFSHSVCPQCLEKLYPENGEAAPGDLFGGISLAGAGPAGPPRQPPA
ncbi:MAG: response regulator transcription factor [Planctomycetota bacterium]